jgi:hypothetical protein
MVHIRFATGQKKNTPSIVWETNVQSAAQDIPLMPNQFDKWLEKDWTPFAFLSSADGGLGFEVAADQDTKIAIQEKPGTLTGFVVGWKIYGHPARQSGNSAFLDHSIFFSDPWEPSGGRSPVSQYYWMEVDAMTQPMKVRQNPPPPYGDKRS